MVFRQHDRERLFVQYVQGRARLLERRGDDYHVELPAFKLFCQVQREILFDDERQLGSFPVEQGNKVRQQKRPDRVDDAQLQGALQLVFLSPGDGLDGVYLFQHGNCLLDDAPAYRGNGDIMGAPFKNRHVQFIFQFFDRHAECRLADEAGRGSPAEVQFTGYGDDIA